MRLQDDMYVIEHSLDNMITIRLNAEHPIYQAHFPGNPITPGVCLIQIVKELLQSRLGTTLALSKVVNIKYVLPVSPVEYPTISVSFSQISEDTHEVKVKGTIHSGNEIVTKFSLIFNKE